MRSKFFAAAIALAVATVAFAVAAPSPAHAFADSSQFFTNKAIPHAATLGASGEGVYFTGAPRFSSLTCSSCHVGAPGIVGLRLGADHPELFTDGYTPGMTYQLEVELTGETKGVQFNTPTCTDPLAPGDTFTYVQCNNNGYALEIDSADGPLAGTLCPQRPNGGTCPMADFTVDESLLPTEGPTDAIFSDRVYSADPSMPKLVTRNGPTRWHFFWTAPQAGTGPLTVYVAAVDGNGGAGTSANDQDPYGDDTVQANFFLQEAGSPVRTMASAGCTMVATSDGDGAATGAAILLVMITVCARGRSSCGSRWRCSRRCR